MKKKKTPIEIYTSDELKTTAVIHRTNRAGDRRGINTQLARAYSSREPELLEQLGLPFYLNRGRFEEELLKHGSVRSAALNNEVSYRGMLNYATQHYGYNKQVEDNHDRQLALKLYFAVNDEKRRPSVSSLARMLGRPRMTIYRWLEAALEGKFAARRGKAASDAA